MTIRTHGPRAFLALALTALAPMGASALQIAEGDVVGVFQKNGTEIIVNLGDGAIDSTVDIGDVVDSLGGSLADAKFVALAVPDTDKTVNCCGGTLVLHNIVYSTLVPDPLPGDLQIEVAMGITDIAGPGVNTWFNLLRQLPGVDSEQVVVSDLFSYQSYLGLGTDAIANSFTFSTAGIIESDGALTIPIYYAQRGYTDFGGPASIHEVRANVVIDGDTLTFTAAPEPAAARTAAPAFPSRLTRAASRPGLHPIATIGTSGYALGT